MRKIIGAASILLACFLAALGRLRLTFGICVGCTA